MPDSLSLVCGHSVHFATFPILRFSKHYSFVTVFIRIQPNFIQSIIIGANIYSLLLFGDQPKVKNYIALCNVCQYNTLGDWKFQNATPPTVFISCQPNFMRTLATMVEYRLLLFLAIGQSFKHFVALWNFNMGVNGKPKMWNISKTDDRRAKRAKIWDSRSYSAHM